MNHVHHIVDDTKDKDTRWKTKTAGGNPGVEAENPEEVMKKIHEQATFLGPVMERILRETQERGISHWGLND